MSKKIALDAGHGLNTVGKQTPDGIKEWTLNDKVRDKVVEMLKDYDVEFVFPDNNEGIIDDGLTARKRMYVSTGVDAAVSIHHNAYTGSWNKATGVEVFTDKNETAKDRQLANAIYSRLVKYTGLKGRGIKEENWTVINQNSIPAVLVEGGFMDSTIDYPIITSDAGQTAYARAVAEGLVAFLGLQKKVVSVPTSTPTPSRNYLMKGDKGAEVKVMQEGLIYLGYDLGKYGADGDFGSGTDSAVRKFQKDNGLVVDGKYGVSSKAKLEALVAEKKKPVVSTPTSSTTYSRIDFIKDVQRAIGTTPDGIVGSKTLGLTKNLVVSKSKNNRHTVVKPLQKYLNAVGYNAGTPDGIFGTKSHNAVVAYQKANGLSADGIVGEKSWKKLFGM